MHQHADSSDKVGELNNSVRVAFTTRWSNRVRNRHEKSTMEGECTARVAKKAREVMRRRKEEYGRKRAMG
jgi:uncharacterized protein YlaI